MLVCESMKGYYGWGKEGAGEASEKGKSEAVLSLSLGGKERRKRN